MKLLFELLSLSFARNHFVHFNNDLIVKFQMFPRNDRNDRCNRPNLPRVPELLDTTGNARRACYQRYGACRPVSHRSDTLLTLARNIHPRGRLSGRMRIDREKKRADGYRRSEMIVRGSRHARSSRSGRRGHWAACSTTNHG